MRFYLKKKNLLIGQWVFFHQQTNTDCQCVIFFLNTCPEFTIMALTTESVCQNNEGIMFAQVEKK